MTSKDGVVGAKREPNVCQVEKVIILSREDPLLGHIILKHGIVVDPKNIEAII